MVSVKVQNLTGKSRTLELVNPVPASLLYQEAAAALGIPPEKFKLILRGKAIENPSESAGPSSSSSASVAPRKTSSSSSSIGTSLQLQQGDVLIATPQRQGPSERVQRAAAAAKGVEPADEDEEALRFKLPAGAPAWERALATLLQQQLKAPELLLVWLWTIGPGRLLVLVLVLAGAKVASWYDLGPIYLLLALIVTIFTHLGTKKEGEASAYSVFNDGVRRLPGQLDADVVDQQIRRGQMM